MNLLILSTRNGWLEQSVLGEATERGHCALYAHPKDIPLSLTGAVEFVKCAIPIEVIDACLIRRTRYQREAAISILHALSSRGVFISEDLSVINPPISKVLELFSLGAEFLYPQTATIWCRSHSIEFLEEFPFPAILKPTDGWSGSGLRFVHSFPELQRWFIEKTETDDLTNYLIQRFIVGDEYRATIVGDKCWLSRSIIGPSFSSIAVPWANPKVVGQALSIAKSVGVPICGIDLIESEEGIFLIECNRNPGVPAYLLESGTLQDAIVDYMERGVNVRPT